MDGGTRYVGLFRDLLRKRNFCKQLWKTRKPTSPLPLQVNSFVRAEVAERKKMLDLRKMGGYAAMRKSSRTLSTGGFRACRLSERE
jgi:hypothetical protein